MDQYIERHRKCPYCFVEFKTGEWSEDVEFTCRSCHNNFTLGEAMRRRPDTAKTSDVAALAERVAALEARLARIEGASRDGGDRTGGATSVAEIPF